MRVTSIVLLFAATVGSLWASTQYVASRLASVWIPGGEWFLLGSARVYPPWAWLSWSQLYERRAPDIFGNATLISFAGSLLGVIACMLLARPRPTARLSIAHGSSRWATTRDARLGGLFRETGVVLGQATEASYWTVIARDGTTRLRARRFANLLCHDGPEHVFCFAPTRSGKGVGLVIPTLLTWRHSVLVYDIKKENWNLTAGWRRQFSRVWRFEPTSPDSVRFNPLVEIRRGLNEIRDTQNVADMLVDPSGEKDSRDHWQLTAHTLLCGAILHVLYAEEDKTLAGVAAFLSEPGRTQTETLERMRSAKHLPDGPHSAVAQIAREMLSKSENELSGVFSTAMASLGLYRDPVIARNTAESDFRIGDLMNADHPVSLYLVVPPSDLARTRPVIRLVLNQIGRRLTESLGSSAAPTRKRRLLFLLDEFPSLGRLEFFESALAFMAGYGIKTVLVAQSLNQLEKAYGPNNSILDNCHVRVTFGANDDRTAKRISDLLGLSTERKTQKSYSGSGLFLTSRTESEQEFARPLLTPAEVMQLPSDDGILFVGGLHPYRIRKVRFFLDPRFKDRAGLPAPNSPEAQERELPKRVKDDWSAPPSGDEPPGLPAPIGRTTPLRASDRQEIDVTVAASPADVTSATSAASSRSDQSGGATSDVLHGSASNDDVRPNDPSSPQKGELPL